MAPSSSGTVDVGGCRLAYDATGDGPAVVLIHAGIADRRMWDEHLAPFGARHRVVRYDQRGFGASKTDAVEFADRDDLLALLDQLGIERAALVGISRGGQIAIDFTLDHPERVRALVAVSAGFGGYPHLDDPPELADFEAMERLEDARDFAALNEYEMRFWLDGPGQPAGRVPSELRERLSAMNSAVYAEHTTEPTPRPLEPPAGSRLEEIVAPTLILVGDLDTSGTQAMADELVRRVPGARRVVFEGAAHMIPMERPDDFDRSVLEFLAGVPA